MGLHQVSLPFRPSNPKQSKQRVKATRDDTGTSTEGPSVEEDPSSGTVAAPPRQEVLSGGTDAVPPRQDVLASGEDQIRAA